MQGWWGSSADEVVLRSSLETGTWTGRFVLDLKRENRNHFNV